MTSREVDYHGYGVEWCEDCAFFSDPEDAELFCLIPELIQLLKEYMNSRTMPDEEESRLDDILQRFDPNFFNSTNPLETLRCFTKYECLPMA